MSTIHIQHSQVEGAKVPEEGLVLEVIVDVQIMNGGIGFADKMLQILLGNGGEV